MHKKPTKVDGTTRTEAPKGSTTSPDTTRPAAKTTRTTRKAK